MTYVLVKLTPDHALSFTYVTVFARTDITSSMIKIAERGYSETCFSFDCTYINWPSYILGTFPFAIYASCDILYAFFQYFSLPAYNFFARQIFCEIVLRTTFNPTFGYIQFQTLMFLFTSLDEDFKCLFNTHIPII